MSTTLDLIKSAGSMISEGYKKMSDTVDALRPRVETILPGCGKVPELARHIDVYFVTNISGGRPHVSGCCLTQRNEILKQLSKPSDCVIFMPHIEGLGISWIAAGNEYDDYSQMTDSELYSRRKENPDAFYIGNAEDIKFLQLRLKLLRAGRVMTRHEVDSTVAWYREWADNNQLNKDDAMWQGLVDLAVGIFREGREL